MKRPYLQFTVAQLEEMYERSKSEPAALKKLVAELRHRQVPKARALLQEVQASLDSLNQGVTGADSAPAGHAQASRRKTQEVDIASVDPEQQSRFWSSPKPQASPAPMSEHVSRAQAPAPATVPSSAPAASVASDDEPTTAWPQTTVFTLTPPEPIRQASIQAERLRAASAGVPAPAKPAHPSTRAEPPAVPDASPATREEPEQEPISDGAPMTVELACKLLKVTATDTWERVEAQRRLVLANTSPLSLKHASEEKSAQAATRAARVNEAYFVLAGLRSAK